MSNQLPHEIVDSRLDILEAENARFDERAAESIKRLENKNIQIVNLSGNFNEGDADEVIAASIKRMVELGYLLDSSGSALNVQNIPEPSDDEFITDDKGEPTTWENAVDSPLGGISEMEDRLEPAEELPHTLPPHIMWLVRQAIHADSQVKSMKEINTPELEGDLRSHKVARKELNKTLAAAVIKYFGGES